MSWERAEDKLYLRWLDTEMDEYVAEALAEDPLDEREQAALEDWCA
jgi:hypothetical protein